MWKIVASSIQKPCQITLSACSERGLIRTQFFRTIDSNRRNQAGRNDTYHAILLKRRWYQAKTSKSRSKRTKKRGQEEARAADIVANQRTSTLPTSQSLPFTSWISQKLLPTVSVMSPEARNVRLRAILFRIPPYLAFMTCLVIGSTFSTLYAFYPDDEDGLNARDWFMYYPLPYAIDVAAGPSMIPTMYADGRDVYFRDCWSHRFIHLPIFIELAKDIIKRAYAGSTLQGDADSMNDNSNAAINDDSPSIKSWSRPWQLGDVVTFLGPDSPPGQDKSKPHFMSLKTKRIIGLPGQTVRVFGEYADLFARHYGNGNRIGDDLVDSEDLSDLGVPRDGRYENPFCRAIWLKKKQKENPQYTTIVVPQNHVWVEGDNPLYSTDSRHYGPIPMWSLRGRLVLRMWPLRRHPPQQIDDKQYEVLKCSQSQHYHKQQSLAIVENNGWCTLSPVRPPPPLDPDDFLRDGRFGVREMNASEIEAVRLKSEQVKEQNQ